MNPQRIRWMKNLCDIADRVSIYSSSSDILSDSSEPTKILNLSANENLFLEVATLKRIMFEVLDAYDPRLYRSNYEELRKDLGALNAANPEQILLGNGSDQILDLLVRSVLAPKDHAIVICPTFSMYGILLQCNGTLYTEVPLRSDFSMDVDSILSSIKPNTRLIFLCSPNNPTGNKQSLESIERLVRESGCLIVLDEAYLTINTSSVKLLEKYDNLVILRTFSKSYGIAGLRIGYALSNNTLISILQNRIQYPFPVSSFSIDVAVRLLENYSLIQSADTRMRTQRSRTFADLKSIRGVTPFPSECNFILFDVEADSREVQRDLLKYGILVRNIDNVLDFSNCLRVTIAPEDMMKQFTTALMEVLS
ncbi:MAG: Histidinol-phosphate aminotransferase [Candidatus Thorarchaeota archaeon]|nr:MAG: Histidinol-phosphate aminotransferase [Candidatus Thorarchaeota archaeon]